MVLVGLVSFAFTALVVGGVSPGHLEFVYR